MNLDKYFFILFLNLPPKSDNFNHFFAIQASYGLDQQDISLCKQLHLFLMLLHPLNCRNMILVEIVTIMSGQWTAYDSLAGNQCCIRKG